MKGMDEMKSSGVKNNIHKDEYNGRIEGDKKDRLLLRQKLEDSIHHFDITQQPENALVNIATGAVIANPEVNIDNSSFIGNMLWEDSRMVL